MLVAVNIKISPATELHSCFCISLGIEFDKLHPVTGDISHKRYEVTLGHWMLYRDKLFVLHRLDSNSVILVGFLSFERRECDTTATDDGCTRSVDDITTDGTDKTSTI